MIEEERKREERYLSFQRGEAEKNRQHELLITQIFANTAAIPLSFSTWSSRKQ